MKQYQNRDKIIILYFYFWLYQKYIIEKLSTVEIGKLCNVHNSTIGRFMKRSGIKIRSISEAKKGFTAWNKGIKNSTIHLPIYEASFNELLSHYKYHAKNRNLTWDLTKEEFRFLTKQNCFYCGKIPSHKSRKDKRFNGIYIYNGIDRIDNNKGYIKENVVPCCGICNKAKGSRSYDEFIAWIKRVNQFIEQ